MVVCGSRSCIVLQPSHAWIHWSTVQL